VYQPNDESRAQFKQVRIGLEDNDKAEILDGLREGEIVISTGAGALRRNDQLLIAGGDGPSQRGTGGQGAPGGRRGPGNGSQGRPGTGTRPGNRPNQDGGQAPSGQEQPQRRPQSSAREGQLRPVA
jgi:hypothetical protein